MPTWSRLPEFTAAVARACVGEDAGDQPASSPAEQASSPSVTPSSAFHRTAAEMVGPTPRSSERVS
ncbi:hypothetical protein EON66_09250 [archaeon]|nr:MAG: hypothetical protein EON66_09250 [archaeon]